MITDAQSRTIARWLSSLEVYCKIVRYEVRLVEDMDEASADMYRRTKRGPIIVAAWGSPSGAAEVRMEVNGAMRSTTTGEVVV